MTNYNKEYKKYLDAYSKYPLIMPSFLEYLRDQRDEAGQRKNWKLYAYFENLIQEDIEDERGYYTEAIEDGRSDADPGL